MGTKRRNRGASKFIVAAAIALSSTVIAAPAANAHSHCDKTVVHKLVCLLIDSETIERLKQALCAVSQETCL